MAFGLAKLSLVSRVSRGPLPAAHQQHRRQRVAFATTGLAALAIGLLVISGAAPARSRYDYEPIGIAVIPDVLVPGQPLPVQVELNGTGEDVVTVFSNPPGAVSYQGTLRSGDTVSAATSSSLTSSSVVTVYAVTDGQSVVQTAVPVQ